MPAILATRARCQGLSFCVDCMCPLTLAGQLGIVGGEAHLLASDRQQENVLTARTCEFPECSRRMPCSRKWAGFQLRAEKTAAYTQQPQAERQGVEWGVCCDPLCLPARDLCFQPGSGGSARTAHLPGLPGPREGAASKPGTSASWVAGVCKSAIPPHFHLRRTVSTTPFPSSSCF